MTLFVTYNPTHQGLDVILYSVYLVVKRLISDQLNFSIVHPFSDQSQVSANLLLETEEVRQNISKLNKEVLAT